MNSNSIFESLTPRVFKLISLFTHWYGDISKRFLCVSKNFPYWLFLSCSKAGMKSLHIQILFATIWIYLSVLLNQLQISKLVLQLIFIYISLLLLIRFGMCIKHTMNHELEFESSNFVISPKLTIWNLTLSYWIFI